jgi:hypothetical protein
MCIVLSAERLSLWVGAPTVAVTVKQLPTRNQLQQHAVDSLSVMN